MRIVKYLLYLPVRNLIPLFLPLQLPFVMLWNSSISLTFKPIFLWLLLLFFLAMLPNVLPLYKTWRWWLPRAEFSYVLCCLCIHFLVYSLCCCLYTRICLQQFLSTLRRFLSFWKFSLLSDLPCYLLM